MKGRVLGWITGKLGRTAITIEEYLRKIGGPKDDGDE